MRNDKYYGVVASYDVMDVPRRVALASIHATRSLVIVSQSSTNSHQCCMSLAKVRDLNALALIKYGY